MDIIFWKRTLTSEYNNDGRTNNTNTKCVSYKNTKKLQGNGKSYNNQTILITFNSIEATCQAGTLTSKNVRKGEGQATEVLVQRFIENKETTSMLNVYMYFIVSLIGATTIYQDMQRLFNITLNGTLQQ